MLGSTLGFRNKIPDTLSPIDYENNRVGRDIKQVVIFKLSLGDLLLKKELLNLEAKQRSDMKLGKIINSLESGTQDTNLDQYFQL